MRLNRDILNCLKFYLLLRFLLFRFNRSNKSRFFILKTYLIKWFYLFVIKIRLLKNISIGVLYSETFIFCLVLYLNYYSLRFRCNEIWSLNCCRYFNNFLLIDCCSFSLIKCFDLLMKTFLHRCKHVFASQFYWVFQPQTLILLHQFRDSLRLV